MVSVLGIFKTATLQISDSNSLLSEVLPTVKSLIKSVRSACTGDDTGIVTLKQQLTNALENRFEEHFDNKWLLIATISDPRFKLSGFLLEETKKNKHAIIIDPEAQAFNYFEKNFIRKLDDLHSTGPPSIVLQMSHKRAN